MANNKKKPDLKLHCVSCVVDNLSQVILFFSSNFF